MALSVLAHPTPGQIAPGEMPIGRDGWLWSYDNERPNMGNSGMTPAQKLRLAA